MTLVEVLSAAAILGIGILGLGTSLRVVGQARSKVAIVNSAIVLQSRIAEAITEPDNYPDANDALRAAIANGDASLITSINVRINNVNVSFPKNTPRFFRRDLTACTGFAGDPDCVLEAKIDFQSAIPNRPIVRGAYRVVINPETQVVMAPFGALNDPFENEDYRFPVPNLASKIDNVVQCDPVEDIGVMGINRDTGQITACIKKPNATAQCPDGTFGKGFVLDPSTNQLVLDCTLPGQAKIPRKVVCPDLYALRVIPFPQLFDPDVPYSGMSPNPTCVWIGRNSDNIIRPGIVAPSINQRLCPRPLGWAIAAYAHNKGCGIASFDAPGTGQGCSIAGCTGSMTPFTATERPTSRVNPSLADTINCEAVPGVTDPEEVGLFSCPGSFSAQWTGQVQITPVSVVQCSLIVDEERPGAWQN